MISLVEPSAIVETSQATDQLLDRSCLLLLLFFVILNSFCSLSVYYSTSTKFPPPVMLDVTLYSICHYWV